jgi:hypothetical protein
LPGALNPAGGNQMTEDKKVLSFKVPAELHKAYQEKAEQLGVTANALYIMALWQYINEEDKDFPKKT